MTEKENACCFTGHRKIPPEQYGLIAGRLRDVIIKLVSGGFTSFYAGGAVGFDTLAALTVLSLKDEYPELRLLLALPCPEQTRGWAAEDIAAYEAVKSKCSEYVYVSQHYTRDCMFKRNRYMVDKSAVCVCFLTGRRGGTAYTVGYAESKGLKIINIAGDILDRF